MDHFLGELVVYSLLKNILEMGAVNCITFLTFECLVAFFWIMIGTLLGTYEDIRFKSSESKKSVLKSVDLFGLGSGPELEKKLKYTEEVCTGVILAKELVNAPANVVTLVLLAEEAENIATTYSVVTTAKSRGSFYSGS